MIRRPAASVLLLCGLLQGAAAFFLAPGTPLGASSRAAAAASRRGVAVSMQQPQEQPGQEPEEQQRRPGQRQPAQRPTAGAVLGAVGRSLAMGGVAVSSFLGGWGLGGGAAGAAGFSYDKQTVQKQVARVDKQEQKELRDEVKDPTNVIAKGIIRLPETEGYPLGPDRPSAINFALENDNAALLLACYGREGGPVAAKKIPLRGLEFPYAFELTAENLLFPLTKETWEKDTRAFDDMGISALLDLDGKFATANENDLIGFGISKPVAIAGAQIRRDALIVVAPRTGVKDYTEQEQGLLSTLDLDLERQAAGASLAQLAADKTGGGGNIEVLVRPRQTEPAEEAGRALLDSIE